MRVLKRGCAASGDPTRHGICTALIAIVLAVVSSSSSAQTGLGPTTPQQVTGGTQPSSLGASPPATGAFGASAPLPPNLVSTGRARYGYDGWQVFPSVSVSSTFTDNGNLAPKGSEKSDVILSATPSIRVSREGARLRFNGNYAPTFLTYVNGSRDDVVLNTLSANGSAELIDDRVFFDGRAQIFQSFLSPFVGRQADSSGVSASRTEIRTFGFGPSARGRFAGGGTYSIRNDNNYTTVAAAGFPDTWTNLVSARVSEAPGTFTVLSADYDFFASTFDNVRSITTQIARARATFNVDPPELSVFLTAGIERNEFRFGDDNQGGVYGGGFNWAPTPRTNLFASYESRFFGPSYLVELSHRTRLAAFRLRGARNASTFQDRAFQSQQTALVLDDAFRSRIPDEAQRQQFVNNAIVGGGLPPFLTLPTGFLTTRYFVNESIDATVAYPGVRNTVSLSLFWRDSKPLFEGTQGTAFADPFSTFNQITQRGGSVTWSYRLFPRTSLSTGADYTRSEGLRQAAGTTTAQPFQGSTIVYRAGVTQQFSPQTFGSASVRLQRFQTTPFPGFEERALIFSATHNF